MPKNIIQDVVPPGKRTIRNIPISNSKPKKRTPELRDFLPSEPPLREENNIPPERPPVMNENFPTNNNFPRRSKSRFGKIFLIVGVLAIASFSLFLMTIFASAKVSVIPKRENVSVNLPIKAVIGSVESQSTTSLVYEIIEASKETEKEAKASGEEAVERKASGKITIYNNFGSESQRLIARTRFQSPEGLIYRISESVTVPGMKTVGGKKEMGSIEVTVYADEAGEKYNIGATEFTIPGFKDDAKRFSGFYAKSKAPMSGGFVGNAKKVSEADKEKANGEMESSLKTELEKEIYAKVSEGWVVLNGAIFYEFNDLPEGASLGDDALLRRGGSARAVVLNKKSLGSAMAEAYLESWGGLLFEIESYEGLSVVFAPDAALSSGDIALTLKGEASMAAEINQTALVESLAGKPKSSLKDIMAGFPAVFSAQAVVKPFWKNTFPSDPSKIHITVVSQASGQ